MSRAFLLSIVFLFSFTAHTLAENSAVFFDGSQQGMTIPNPMASAGQKFTWEAWVQPGSTGFGGPIYFHRAHYRDKGLFASSDRAGLCTFSFHFLESVQGGGSGEANADVQVAYSSGDWFHVAATYDGEDMKLYVNGQLRSAATARK